MVASVVKSLMVGLVAVTCAILAGGAALLVWSSKRYALPGAIACLVAYAAGIALLVAVAS